MAKATDLMSRFGANVAESMGAGRQSRGGSPTSAKPDPEDGTERLRSAAVIEVDRIVPDPNQPRTEFDEASIQELADSLSEHGQIQPIVVRWDDEMGRYLIVAGERRWRATLKAGRKTIDAVILDPGRSESEILQLQLIENCLREGLTPVAQGRAFRKLMDQNGWSGDQLARTLHISDASVFRALALLTLPTEVQSQVEQGALTPATAYEVSKLDDVEAQRQVAARVVAEGMNRAETIQAVRQVSKTSGARAGSSKGRAGKGKAKPVTSRVFRHPSGVRLTAERGKGIELPTLAEVLREALGQVERELNARESEAA